MQNLGLKTLDVHYIHIPEITRLYLTEDEFYPKMEVFMGDGLKKYSVRELLLFALNDAEHVIVGSKNTDHIKELLSISPS